MHFVAARREQPALGDGGPLYDKVYRALRSEIEGGGLRPGDHLPSERLIGEKFDVSRVTARRALQQLAKDGLTEGRRVVSIGEPRNSLLSFSIMGADRGLTTTSTVLSCRVREATIDEAEMLRMAPGGPIFELHRARMLGGLPVAIDESHLSHERVAGIERVDFSTASLYETLREQFGIIATRADYALEAAGASAAEARVLEVDAGTPVLRASETMYDQHDQPTDIGRIIYRGDRYRFRTTLTRRSS
jgi:GntR family transcriptional regulator